MVVTWVDGNDPIWLNEKKLFENSEVGFGKDSKRFQPSDLFRYWFRGIEKYAPWVNKIFFVTYGHVPSWLNKENTKLKIIKHSEFIPEEYLPTYNSNVIELNLHRIEELSEKFILFNDDMFLMNKVTKEDFFVGDKIKDYVVYRPVVPVESFNHIEVNNTVVMNKYFNHRNHIRKMPFKFFRIGNGVYNVYNLFSVMFPFIIGYKTGHVSQPHFKSTFRELWNKEKELLDKTSKNKFRSEKDVSHFLMAHWNLELEKVIPQNYNFGKYFSNNEINDIINVLKKGKYKVICINDDSDLDYSVTTNLLIQEFEKKFPDKSSYEI